jgi:DOMON domain/Copper type II ascorbate-dependent monooxygenase, C-terminal domain/Copper type II ascorbate-dependent monooxygenase, N-terminal domain
MKFNTLGKSAAILLIPATLFISTATAQCDSDIARAIGVCTHFGGVDAEPYQSWYTEGGLEAKYPGMVYLPGSDPEAPENGAAIHWKVDDDEGILHLAIAARATGWVAFGIGEAGGMLGSDMAIFEAAKPNEIIDAYAADERLPYVDDCPSDWVLVSTEIDEEGGFIMVEFKRKLDTKDAQDKVIFNDAPTLVSPHRVITAWGDSATFSYHGLNRARGAIRFYGTGDDQDAFDEAMAEQAEGSFVVASREHLVSTNETEYAHTCILRDDLISQGVLDTTELLNIIGFEPLIQEGNEAFVHHYIITGFPLSACGEDDFGRETVYVWAPGEGPISLPSNLGTPMFGTDGFNAFEIEVHYNNPSGISNVIDSSGVRIYWTSQPREFQIGILQLGDPNVALFGEPVGNGQAFHSFECPGSCSTEASTEVTVLREYLHMHSTGARITNEQIREGVVVRKASVEYWEFDQNGNTAVQQNPYNVLPGDGFKTACYFNGEDKVFGMGSGEEMCMAFLYYYPRSKIRIPELNIEFPWVCGYRIGYPPCETDHQELLLNSIEDLQREFGISSVGACDREDDIDTSVQQGSDPASIISYKTAFFATIFAFLM